MANQFNMAGIARKIEKKKKHIKTTLKKYVIIIF